MRNIILGISEEFTKVLKILEETNAVKTFYRVRDGKIYKV
jgi:hypothetical protein